MSLLARLERYTEKRRQEVLLVTAMIGDETEQIMIFRGFSSSLTKPTAFDPDIPILPETAVILTVDRLAAPYNPKDPQYIQKDLTEEAIAALLQAANL